MKYVLITGASTGIGLACARYLLDRGYGVLGSLRRESDAERLQKELGPHFHPLLFDVCDLAAIEKTIPQVEAIVGSAGLTGLINNAGIAVSGPLALIPVERVRYQLEVNVMGVIQVTRSFLPLLGAQLPARANPGRVINISSVSGAFAAPFVGPYCASKYALEAITDSWRRELLIYGVDMISIRPGPIQTPIWQKTLDKLETYPDSDYGPLLRKSEKMVQRSEADGLPAERVAEVAFRALTKRRPRTRYIVAKNKLSFHLLFNWVPDRVVDFFVRRAFRKMAR